MNKKVLIIALSVAVVSVGFLFFSLLWTEPAKALIRPLGYEELANGDLLVTDGGGALWDDRGSKILIIDKNKKIKWMYDKGLKFAHSATMLSNGNILIPDTNNDRLIEVTPAKEIVWSSESWSDGKGLLEDKSHLSYPNHVQEMDNGHLLVSDRLNNRVIEIDREGKIYWKFTGAKRQHGPKAIGPDIFLVADSDGNRILEINRKGEILWKYDTGLKWPRDAVRMANGNTLITDSMNNRVIEVTREGQIIFETGRFETSLPYMAGVLKNGNIMISDSQHSQFLEIDRKTGKKVWEFRNFNNYLRYIFMPSKIINGNIEKLDKNGRPIGWFVCDLISHNTGKWNVDKTISHGGQNSLSITGLVDNDMNKWWGQAVKTRAGGNITLKAYIRTEDVITGGGIAINFFDRKGAIIGGLNGKPVNGTNGWESYILTGPVPPGSLCAGISLSLIGKGKIWFDNISIKVM